jgi:hypothetical protein
MISAGLYVMGPIHLLAQLTALRTLHAGSAVQARVFVHWPWASDDVLADLVAIFRVMTRQIPEVCDICPVPQATIDDALSASEMSQKCQRLIELMGPFAFDEIYFPHDVMGTFYQLLAGANATARRITTGENLGHVFEREVYYSYFAQDPPARGLRGFADKMMDRIRGRKRRYAPAMPVPDFKPDLAALLLPVDQSGTYLRDIALQVPPRMIALGVLNACRAACVELNDYMGRLLASTDGQRRYILCLQNFAECGTIDFETDVAMWVDIVRTECEPGSVVFLKTHPAETLPRTATIFEHLRADYRVLQLEPAFRRYPIELWGPLVTASTTISSSMPALSLRYFYDVVCRFPFTETFIERWFPQKVWRFYKNGALLFSGPLDRYDSWDGKNLLWAAGRR